MCLYTCLPIGVTSDWQHELIDTTRLRNQLQQFNDMRVQSTACDMLSDEAALLLFLRQAAKDDDWDAVEAALIKLQYQAESRLEVHCAEQKLKFWRSVENLVSNLDELLSGGDEQVDPQSQVLMTNMIYSRG